MKNLEFRCLQRLTTSARFSFVYFGLSLLFKTRLASVRCLCAAMMVPPNSKRVIIRCACMHSDESTLIAYFITITAAFSPSVAGRGLLTEARRPIIGPLGCLAGGSTYVSSCRLPRHRLAAPILQSRGLPAVRVFYRAL